MADTSKTQADPATPEQVSILNNRAYRRQVLLALVQGRALFNNTPFTAGTVSDLAKQAKFVVDAVVGIEKGEK